MEVQISGAAGDGTSTLAALRALGTRIIPPFPGPDLVPMVVTPPPPLMSPRLTDPDRAKALAQAYRGGVERRYPELGACYYARRGEITSFRDYPKLVEAARLLLELEVPPVGWVLFSIDTWMFYMGDKSDKPPTVAWTFSAARIVERHGWYEEQAGTYAGGQVYMADAHRLLAATHQAMTLELLRVRPKTRDEVAQVVDHYFPGDRYERMLADARAGATRLQTMVQGLVAKGGAW